MGAGTRAYDMAHKLRFIDLAIGDTFDFPNPTEPGPWVKLSPRKYGNRKMICRVGTIYAEVIFVILEKPSWENCDWLQ